MGDVIIVSQQAANDLVYGRLTVVLMLNGLFRRYMSFMKDMNIWLVDKIKLYENCYLTKHYNKTACFSL